MKKRLLARLLLVMLLLSGSLLAAESPFSGTWKFNPTKGHPTPPLPKSVIAHVEADADTFKYNVEGVDEKDQPFRISYEASFDGKEYPIIGDPSSDSVSLRRVNEREIKDHHKESWEGYIKAGCSCFERRADRNR